MTDVLPRRCCSRCHYWGGLTTISSDRVIVSMCAVEDEPRSGGETCDNWKRRAELSPATESNLRR